MAEQKRREVAGTGLGLRREFLTELGTEALPPGADFLEIAPENWIHIGGALAGHLRALTERFPFVCHGLSLSLGGPGALSERLVRTIKSFMTTHGITLYTEHLAYCSGTGHLYGLLPLPFTEEAVRHVAARIRQTQDILGQRIAVENTSYYAHMPTSDMSELAFTLAVLKEADCLLHLDVNNVYVNSVNHGFDPLAFIDGLPTSRIAYMHVAGHDRLDSKLLVDTHGAPISDPVWSLLEGAYRRHGVAPTALERDMRIPALVDLEPELVRIGTLQRRCDHVLNRPASG